MKIVISHGSGGVGPAEHYIKTLLENHGYDVYINDYFTPHNINSLRWSEIDPDDYDVTFNELFNVSLPDEDMIHIGFSLGGYFGLINSEKFKKNILFYPAVLGYTQQMLEKDYSNTMVILCSEDPGKIKYERFHNELLTAPPLTYTLVGAHHAFMVEGIDREFNMTSYGGSYGGLMSDEDFKQLKPNHRYLSSKYTHKTRRAVLKYHKDYRHQYAQIVKEEIDETVTGLRTWNRI